MINISAVKLLTFELLTRIWFYSSDIVNHDKVQNGILSENHIYLFYNKTNHRTWKISNNLAYHISFNGI